jgi:hypothetical protein
MAPERHPNVIHHFQGHVWVALPLDEEWDAYVRLVPQDGHPVIAELRVLPVPVGGSNYGLVTAVLDDAARGGPAASEPFIELSPDSLPADIPKNGLTARALRRIHLGIALELVYEVLPRWIERERGVEYRPLSLSGFTSAAAGAPRRPGRKGRDDSFYAAVSAAYVDALRRGSRQPVVDAARTLGEAGGGVYKPAYVRDLLHVARGRGLLTRPPRGRAGGELTGKAIEALRQHGEERQ